MKRRGAIRSCDRFIQTERLRQRFLSVSWFQNLFDARRKIWVTKESWESLLNLLSLSLGEFFRLRHVRGRNFSTAVAALYVGGA